jgi:hypothetical protein
MIKITTTPSIQLIRLNLKSDNGAAVDYQKETDEADNEFILLKAANPSLMSTIYDDIHKEIRIHDIA